MPTLPHDDLDVSVVVPVWNPGPNLERCVRSLLAQTLPATRRELLFVDDGSTDGTAARLDALAAEHPDVRVVHIANSGWPGRPRNVGLDAAQGRYVHFVDNDDVLPPYALADLVAAADADSSDVAFGKAVSDFRGLNHRVYRRNLSAVTLADEPELVETLTPHKMFRREFLHEHGIRFPEGPVPLEDQFVVLPAFVHARAITVLGDRPYYYYLRRIGSGRNAGDRPIDVGAHFTALEQILDLAAQAPDPQRRDRLYQRFYRVNLLRAATDRAQLDADETHQQQVADAVSRIVRERFGPGVTDGVGAVDRIAGRLLRDGDTAGLRDFAEQSRRVWTVPPVCTVRADGRSLVLDVDTYLARADRDPLVCERDGDDWLLPAYLSPAASAADRLLDDERSRADVEVSLLSRATNASSGITDGLSLRIADDGQVRVRGTVRLDTSSALSGHPVEDGLWDVKLRVRFAGWDLMSPVRVGHGLDPIVTSTGSTVSARTSGRMKDLLLDVGQWAHSLSAELAPRATVTAVERRSLELSVPLLGALSVPAVLLLHSVDLDDSQVLTFPGQVRARGPHRSSMIVTLPSRVASGRWRPWVRIDHPSGEATALDCHVVTGGRELTVEPLAT